MPYKIKYTITQNDSEDIIHWKTDTGSYHISIDDDGELTFNFSSTVFKDGYSFVVEGNKLRNTN